MSSIAQARQTSKMQIRILITGGLGFVGSAIVRAVSEQHPEWDIYILDQLDQPCQPSATGEDSKLDLLRGCKYEYLQADITNQNQVMMAFDKAMPNAVVHTAGMIPDLSERYQRRLEALVKNVNVNGTRNVVHAAAEHGCLALVYTSSCTAIIDDLDGHFPNIDESWPVSKRSSIYGESKAEAEEIVLAANKAKRHASGHDGRIADPSNLLEDSLTTCVLRPSVIFGEGDNQLVPSIHACIRKGETRYRIGDGNNMWDTVYVGNVADAHVLAVENLISCQPRLAEEDHEANNVKDGNMVGGTAAGETFFIQNNKPIPFRDFSLAIWKEFGHFPPPWEIWIPAGLGWILGLFAELFTRISSQATTLSRGSVRDACATRYASGDKARRVLGYRPRIALEVGLRRSCQDYEMRRRRQEVKVQSRPV